MADLFNDICAMLTERGMEKPDEILRGYLTLASGDGRDGDAIYDGALGAIKRWDDRLAAGDQVGTGLLRKFLLDGGFPGYKSAEERSSAPGTLMLTEKRLSSIRRVCFTPNGSTREIERGQFGELAGRLGMGIDELLDTATFRGWKETPPHPAYPWTGTWEGKPDDGVDRYGAAVLGETPVVAHPVPRAKGESDWELSRRFWRYEETPEMLKAGAARLAEIQERRARAAEARAIRERAVAHRKLQASKAAENARAAKALGYENDTDEDHRRRVAQARSDEPLDDLW